MSLEMSELGRTMPSPGTGGLFEAVRDGVVQFVNERLNIKQTAKEIDNLDQSGLSLLHQAARYNRRKVAATLLDHGAVIDVRTREEKLTPLQIAARFKCVETLELLIERGANPSLTSSNGSTALHLAARRGNDQIAELLLRHPKVDVNAKDLASMTPLHLACVSGNVAISKMLLGRGADIRAKSNELMTPLHTSVYHGNTEVTALILQSVTHARGNMKELVGDRDSHNNTILHLAAGANDLNTAELCLQYEAEIDARRSDGETPLYVATVKGNLQMVQLLVKRGADVAAKNAESKSVLHRAAVFNRDDIISFLLDNGVPIDTPDAHHNTPFLDAVAAGQTKCARLLFQRGADFKACDIYMKNCVHMAVENENLETLNMLLEEKYLLRNLYSPDVQERVPLHYAAMVKDVRIMDALLRKHTKFTFHDETQQTPLHLAAQEGMFAHVEALARRVASGLDERDDKGRTALHNAVMNGHRKVCYALLKLGADADCPDNDRWTPLMWACKLGFEKSCQELLTKQTTLDCVNMEGDTALHIACRQGHVNVVKLLLDNGANMTVCNTQSQTCLESAVRAGNSDVAMTMVKHSRWHEITAHKDKYGHSAMKLLIEHFPESAELLMDRCVKRSEMTGSDDPNFSITYDFHLLDPGPDDPAFALGRRFFGPRTMVKSERMKLLLHPLTQVLLNRKWSTFGRFLYYFNFLSYLLFVGSYSAFIVTERQKLNFTRYYRYEEESDEWECEYFVEDSYSYNDSEELLFYECNPILIIYEGQTGYNAGISYVVFVFAVIHLLKEIIEIIIQRCRYFKDFSNLLEWLLYGTSFTFMIPYVMPEDITQQLFQRITDPYNLWLVGVTSVFLCYANLVLFLRRFRLFGIYVTMFVEVTKTVLKVFVVFVVFIIGFAIVFFVLFKEQDAFLDIGRAFISVMVMMVGEFEFDDKFIKTIGKKSTTTQTPLNPFPDASFVFLAIFLLLMSIILMNLLVGLAVGDIESIQHNATLKRLAMQVEFVAEIEESYPRFITRRLYRPTLVFRPNRPSRWKRFMAWLGIKNSSKLDFGLPADPGDSNLSEYNQVRKQLDKTKRRIKTLVNVIDAQNTLLRRLARKIDPGGEMDSSSLEDIRPIMEECPDIITSDFLDGQSPQETDENMSQRGFQMTAC